MSSALGGPNRRTFLFDVFVLIASIGRRAWAQATDYARYQPLVRPVTVPLDALSTPSTGFAFMADGMTLASAATPNQPVRFNGMVVRTSSGGNSADLFKAICLKCPHEGCDVEFIRDAGRVPQEVTDALGKLNAAVYICPCHNSTFKMDDGSKMFGPTPRGLYRFRVTSVNETAIEIGEIEEDALVGT